MSRHTTQQSRGIRKEKSIVTKEFPVTTEIAKDSKRSCHDRENSITAELTGEKGKCLSRRKRMSQQILEGQGHEKLVINRLGVATQGIPVATRTRLMNKIYVRHYQSMSQHNPRASPENRSRQQKRSYDRGSDKD